MATIKNFQNSNISFVLNVGESVGFLARKYGLVDGMTFTLEQFENFGLPVSLQTLRKYDFVRVAYADTWKVYVDDSSYGYSEKIDMTDEQYEQLPDYFKQQVRVETRIRNHYAMNVSWSLEFEHFSRQLRALMA